MGQKKEFALHQEQELEDLENRNREEESPPIEAETPDASDETARGGDLVQLYFRQMGQVPLLTREQEQALAKKMKAAERALEKGLKQNGLCPPEALQQLERQYVEAKNEMVRANLRLVVSIAKRYLNRGLSLLDLIQEGNLGVMKAVGHFDYRRGYRFSTYATWWIRQAIGRAIANQARTVRLPVHVVELIGKIDRASREIVQRKGHEPTLEEIAKDVHLSPDKVRQLLQAAPEAVSLQTMVEQHSESELGGLIEDPEGISPAAAANHHLLKEELEEILSTLSAREKEVLVLRYGLDDSSPESQEVVGKRLSLSRERVRQIESQALHKLRFKARNRRLDHLLQGGPIPHSLIVPAAA